MSTAGTSAQAQTCTATSTAVTAVSPGDAAVLAGDCTALLGMVDTLRGTADATAFNWTDTLSMASWWGITLTSDKNRVARLEYQVAGLKGTIPALSALTGLTHLSFTKNELTGSIPDLSALTSLQELRLNSNKLAGGIPDLSALTSLQKIHLTGGDNQFTGPFPDLSALTSLQELLISGNRLTGSFPNLSAQTSLKRLHLDSNDLTGNIVAAHLPSSLTHLYLGANDWTGRIPDLSALTSLEFLSIHSTDLTGSIPDLSKLTSLKTLLLTSNDLTGGIPDLSALTSLKELRLQGNRLSGNLNATHFPTNLTILWLYDNELTGSIPNLNAHSSLSALDLGSNKLSGSIDASHFPSSLRYLYLDRNDLTGSIPDLSALTSLRDLYIHGNDLSDAIPTTLPTSLVRLLLSGNPKLSGGIPGELGNLTGLADLSLCETGLTDSATLPSALETRRSGNLLTVWSCLSIADAATPAGTTLSFDLAHSTWPVRGGDAMTVNYGIGDAAASGSVTVPAIGATETEATAKIEVATDGLVGRVKVTVSVPSGSKALRLRDTAYGTAPSPPPPDPDPSPEPPPPGEDATPTGGTVSGSQVALDFGQSLDTSSVPDASAFTVTSTSSSAASASSSPDKPASVAAAQTVNHTVTGVEIQSRSVVLRVSPRIPAGASVRVSYTKGAKPLRTEAGAEIESFGLTVFGDPPVCPSRVTPYWHGTGGFAVRPTDGESAMVRIECAGRSYTSREHAGEDGLIVRTVSQPMCTAEDGRPIEGEMTFEGIDGDGWYWVNGDRNVAVAPLVCEESLNPELRPPVPGGVTARPAGDRRFVLSVRGTWHGTLMVHDESGFMGIVPHLVDLEGDGEHVAPYWKGGGGIVGRPLDGGRATVRLACGDADAETHVLDAGEDGLIAALLPGCFDEDGAAVSGRLEADGLEDGAWYWLNVDNAASAAPLVRRGTDADLTVPLQPAGVDAQEGPLGTLLSRGRLMGIVPRLERADN